MIKMTDKAKRHWEKGEYSEFLNSVWYQAEKDYGIKIGENSRRELEKQLGNIENQYGPEYGSRDETRNDLLKTIEEKLELCAAYQKDNPQEFKDSSVGKKARLRGPENTVTELIEFVLSKQITLFPTQSFVEKDYTYQYMKNNFDYGNFPWPELQAEWNDKHPDRPYTSSESMRVAYRQAVKRNWEMYCTVISKVLQAWKANKIRNAAITYTNLIAARLYRLKAIQQLPDDLLLLGLKSMGHFGSIQKFSTESSLLPCKPDEKWPDYLERLQSYVDRVYTDFVLFCLSEKSWNKLPMNHEEWRAVRKIPALKKIFLK